MKYIVDSSGWLEYFANTKNAKNFAEAIEDNKNLIVPTITIYEVFKKILLEKDKDIALEIAAHMKQGTVIDLDIELALLAGKLGKDLKLPMADSIILATTIKHNATLLTQDADFKNIENVKYFKKN